LKASQIDIEGVENWIHLDELEQLIANIKGLSPHVQLMYINHENPFEETTFDRQQALNEKPQVLNEQTTDNSEMQEFQEWRDYNQFKEWKEYQDWKEFKEWKQWRLHTSEDSLEYKEFQRWRQFRS